MYGVAGQQRMVSLDGNKITRFGNCLDVANEEGGVVYNLDIRWTST